MYKVILASASPRRQELLKQINIDYSVMVSQADETYDKGLAPSQVVEVLSLKKARAVMENIEPEEPTVIIAADTIVALENTILGKPRSPQEAEKMLLLLSGKAHKVHTGVTMAFIDGDKKELVTFSDFAEVYFRELELDEIKAYIDTKEPLDKAGAYGIQEKGAILVEKIKGDYYTIVGLPLVKVYMELKKKNCI